MGAVPGVPTEFDAAPRMLPGIDEMKFDEPFWVSAAEGAVRDYCGWHVSPILQQTFAMDGEGRSRILLDTMRLVEVVSVTVDGQDVTGRVKAAESGVLEMPNDRCGFGRGLNSVIVVAKHGYDPREVPSVVALIASLAERFSSMFGNVIQSRSAGGSSESFFAGSEALISTDRAKLEKYRLRGRS